MQDINLNANMRYNHLFTHGFDASDTIYETSNNFGVLTSLAEFDGPMNISLAGRELRWIGYAASTYLPGNASQAYDFDYFVELGGGVEVVDRSVIEGVEGVSLRGSAIAGNGITGWSIYAKIEF